ncbi:aspartyl-phosphate phosphatase Spo0E family protein [Bacillus sp. Marseille-P3661]|uniref:aspartyl-phosphate phosphatase Spo0E family protein n=1 Tax=Bacillus sp. Marseille-P3661 TaxID=1936234 RepID=UPI000C8363AB|nr:aspartyl-phosphate phosphatase Spo0E family protein [Bacillus sp. Marseille-P3661]
MYSKQPHKQIELYRKLMIESSLSKGLNHPNTIALSQKLDKVINQYQVNKYSQNS